MKLVTGGEGLVGRQFGEQYLKVKRSDVDLTDRKETIDFFKKLSPTIVIHTAAKVGGLYSNSSYQADYFEENIRINTNVLEACRLSGVKRMVAFLSTCVFPDNARYPLTEEQIHLGPPHSSNYGYAYAKRMLDVQIQTYNQQHRTAYFSVIPCNIYGTGDNFNLKHAHVIPALIHKVFLSRESKTPLQVPGDGSALREFVFARDLPNIIERLLDYYYDGRPVIISNPEEVSIRIVVEMICEIMNYKGKTEWLSHLPNGQHRKPSSNKRLIDVIGQPSFTPIFEGLSKTIAWFENNYPHIRM